MPSNPAADVRQMIEDVQARHYKDPYAQSCNCNSSWPCDAYLVARRLEQAVAALEARERFITEAHDILKRDYSDIYDMGEFYNEQWAELARLEGFWDDDEADITFANSYRAAAAMDGGE